MAMIWRDLIGDTRFRFGLGLRLFLVLAATPKVQTIWFLPFLSAAPGGGLDPWTSFLRAGGDAVAFPYGLPYVAAFGPEAWLGRLIGGDYGERVGLGLGILFWELMLLAGLLTVAGAAHRPKVMTFFWLSPIALYVGYWHGQLDFFPVALLVGSLAAIKRLKWLPGGLLFGLAVAAKFSMALPALFIALYFIGRPRLRSVALEPLFAAVAVPVALIGPFALSEGFRQMVVETPEGAKAFSLAVEVSPGINLYLLPMAYLALLYFVWRIRKLDFEMLWTFTGIGFLAFLLLTPASPGWSVWALPFLALHSARSDVKIHLLYWPFCISFLGLHLIRSTGALLLGGLDLTEPLGLALPPGLEIKAASVMMTLLVATGLAMAAQMIRGDILNSPFRQATRRPLAIGIGGDSGAGKDTLVDSIIGMFGNGNVAHLSGDDYHLWDRHKPMWRAVTHLNPQANELGAFASNVASLIDGRTVRARHYDHSIGRMSKPGRVDSAEIVAASGLHALWSPTLNRLYDLKIFLDMDEDLRRFLKTQRDVNSRGYSPRSVARSIERRWPDSVRFVQPQANEADIIMRLESRHPSVLSDLDAELSEAKLRLVVFAAPGEDFDKLSRLLTSLCGMKVIEAPLDDGRTEIAIEGEPTAEDIGAAVRRLAAGARELLDLKPVWRPGLRGVMQLIVLDQLQKARSRRSFAG